uniref:Uncharacterized protein n=1 Tax=Kalanchoe fedtschenkoi TaxID=63787 RepID=A0A7N0TZX5_KALFE
MSSDSTLTHLNLISIEDYKMVNHGAALANPAPDSGVENATGGDGDPRPASADDQRRIIVSKQLPIKARRDPVTKDWTFEFDNDALVLQLKLGFRPETPVVYVGCLNASVPESEQEEVAAVLLERFSCVPAFIADEVHNQFYHGFCKHYLWPLFHYMLPVIPSQGARFDHAQWLAYISANKVFADKVMEVLSPDEDYVWIHDYHLIILATMLRKKFNRVKLGFFLHSPFPSSEIFRTLPVREVVLKALLNCDLVGFHTFDYARHFLSCCSRILGLDHELKRGYIGLDYYGRTVIVKILPVGIHMGQLEEIMSQESTAAKVRELRDKYQGKIVLLGVDDVDLFKGIGMKFRAFERLLESRVGYVGELVLVQILNPARSSGKDVQDVQEEFNSIAERVNARFGGEGYKPIELVDGGVTTNDKVAYYSIAECVIVNAIRDGMNLVPYKYTVCRQGSPLLDEALGVNPEVKRRSVIIVSEFIGCSPSLSGAIRVNPWDVDSVAEGMGVALSMHENEMELRHEKHYKFVSSHDVAYWARSLDQDLEKACRDHFVKRVWEIGFGLNVKVVALGPNFRKLLHTHIVPAYKSAASRLILLDYDGTMTSQGPSSKAPTESMIECLNRLTRDPNNVVFIVSGRDRKTLVDWFSPCEKLGIAAEHGYFMRWSKDDEWESPNLNLDFDWKRIAEPVMELYTEATDGSYIEHKESALVWQHQEADYFLGSCQAKELLDHLESVLANEPVVVKRGQHIVEVIPQGISKGMVVSNVLSKIQARGAAPDFVLCIGDDRSDEDMFETIASSVSNSTLPATAQVFACTVGQKPSKAKYYLDDSGEVMRLLHSLAGH